MVRQTTTELLRAAVKTAQSGRPEEVRRAWLRVVEREDHPIALNALGKASLQEGDALQAKALFKRAVFADPAAAVLHFNHANACRALGDDLDERESLLAALQLEPLDLMGNVRLAELCERTGDVAGANERWSAVLSIAANINPPPASLKPILERASAYVLAQTEALAAHVDSALAAYRDNDLAFACRRAQSGIDYLLGRRKIYLNQCSGLHVPFLPADEFFDRAMLPWLADLEAATETIRSELRNGMAAAADAFVPYVDMPPGTPANIWSALDRSRSWSALHLWRDGARDAAACALFPQTAAVIDALPLAHVTNRMPTVFFSVLAPRTHIPPHTGVSNARAIVHLPLFVPDGCRFRVGGEERRWREREAFAFDDTIEHEAWNDSAEPRIILIIDTWNPHLTTEERAMLTDFYRAADSDARAPAVADRARLG